MGRLERKNTIKKNVEEIVGFVPPEVKFRQQQAAPVQYPPRPISELGTMGKQAPN